MIINLNDDLSRQVEQLAKQQQKPISQLVELAVSEMLEEYQDIKSAEETLAQITSGKEKTYSLSEAEQYLNDLDS